MLSKNINNSFCGDGDYNPVAGDHAADDPTRDSVHHNTGSSDPAHD